MPFDCTVADLDDIVFHCNERLGIPGFPDFPGAFNGLQVAGRRDIQRIGAAVDAGLKPFQQAAARKIDLLLVHHGLFWQPPRPWTGVHYETLKMLIQSHLAVYSAHLPLDAHPEIGNNALLAAQLKLGPVRTFLPFEEHDIGLVAAFGESREVLRRRLGSLFSRVTAIEFGADAPREVAIVTGGGYSAMDGLVVAGVDTLVTGELKEHCFNLAQEHRLNLYACGHYATEVFGVRALASELSEKFSIPWEFIATDNPL